MESVGANLEMTELLQLAAFRNMVGDLEENMHQINEQMQRNRTVKKGQMEFLKLKSTIAEVNNHWLSLIEDCRWQAEESLSLKIRQWKLHTLSKIERKED